MFRADSPDPNEPRIASDARELDSRASDGIHVQLLWHPLDGHVSVAVSDHKAGEAFELEVRCGQEPLDVFRHPYAYVATNLDSMSGGSSVALDSYPC